jgi:hypothetical protein
MRAESRRLQDLTQHRTMEYCTFFAIVSSQRLQQLHDTAIPQAGHLQHSKSLDT